MSLRSGKPNPAWFSARPLCEAVNAENAMVSALGQLGAGEPLVPFVDPDAWRNLRIHEVVLYEMFSDFQRAFESAGALLDLAL